MAPSSASRNSIRCCGPLKSSTRAAQYHRSLTVPWSIANASYKQQQGNPGHTQIVEMAGRGHSLIIDNGWREVADTALAFTQRFTDRQPAGAGTASLPQRNARGS